MAYDQLTILVKGTKFEMPGMGGATGRCEHELANCKSSDKPTLSPRYGTEPTFEPQID